MRHNTNKIQWCPGCWNYLIHIAIKQALAELQIPAKDTVVVTGIWCNSKMSQYLEWYWAESLHWRSIPFAIGVKLANPKLTVISLSWDWDTYWIWIWHLIHAARRNIPILHITCDNENYALTTWQASATTPVWVKTKSTPEGNNLEPLHPINIIETCGCTFVKSIPWNDLNLVKETIKNAIKHNWFSHINIQQACPSWKRW